LHKHLAHLLKMLLHVNTSISRAPWLVIVWCEPIGKRHAFPAQSPSPITWHHPNDGLWTLEGAPISGTNLEDGKSFSEGVLLSKVAKSFA
jgi:hypothetical protein